MKAVDPASKPRAMKLQTFQRLKDPAMVTDECVGTRIGKRSFRPAIDSRKPCISEFEFHPHAVERVMINCVSGSDPGFRGNCRMKDRVIAELVTHFGRRSPFVQMMNEIECRKVHIECTGQSVCTHQGNDQLPMLLKSIVERERDPAGIRQVFAPFRRHTCSTSSLSCICRTGSAPCSKARKCSTTNPALFNRDT